MTKCKGGCQMRAGGKTCKKCGCDMKDEEYEKGEKEMRSGGSACMKCGGKMHKSGGTVSSCMKCGGGKYTFGGKVKWAKKYANGGLVYDDTEPPYDAPDTKVASGDGRLKRKKLSYAEKQYYAGLKNRNLDPTEANNMLRSAGYPTIYDIKNETTPMEPGMKMTQYDVYGDPNNALRPMYKNIMTDTSPNILPGFKMFLGMMNKPTPTSFGETFQEALSENNYLNAIKNLDEIKSKNASMSGASYMFGGEVNWLKKKVTDKYASGGAVSGMKKYFYGGETDNTKMTDDTEIQLGRGAFNVSEPAYDANKIMSRVFDNALSIKESEQPTTKQTGYKEEVEKNKVVQDDKSLPNWGRAKKEQQILNELIRKDIASGKAKMGLLEEDDIIGDYTLGAMREYEASGQYKRPELFKDKWLAEYKKQWDEMQKSKSSAGNQESKTETSWAERTFGFNKSDLVEPSKAQNTSSNTSSGPFGWADKYLPNKYKENKPGWGVLAPEQQKQNTKKGVGWSKEQLLKEGGIEMDSKELSPKDFDTYQPIKGFTKSKKGIRATGRDRSDAYFDAVEKSQYFDLNGLKANTSINLINELLTKSKKVIIIPKGQDKHGRDLNDIYLQDENDPSKYHALDSLGVVNREAIFGEYLTGEESRMTDRQKMITGQAQEKGGFKYNMSPSIFRKVQQQLSPEQSNNVLTNVGQTIQDWSKPFSLKLPTTTTTKESPKTTTTKSKEEPLFPLFEKLYETPKEDVKSKPKSTSVPKSEENTMFFPSFRKLMEGTNNVTTNNTERDNQYEQLARDIEADYENEQKSSKLNKGYAPISISPSMPIINNENLLVEKEVPNYIKNAKGQLIATDFNNQQKEKKAEERLKRINEGADKYINLNLKKAKNREDIKYNIKAINDYHSKIDEALSMLSGTTDNSKQGFTRMTATESIRYNPETNKREPHFEPVSDEEYERLTVIHVFLENELDKIYKDPRYKNESAFVKKRILQRKLHESQKKMTQMQYEMKKQINDFN